jgi:acyl-CoA thioesterase I
MNRWLFLILCAGFLTFAAEPRKRVVVLGDSIAAGYGLDQEEAFPALLQKKIDQAKLPYEVINAGVSGDTTAGGARRISWILKQAVDVLLIELGGNDGLRGISPEETGKNLQTIIDRTRSQYPKATIVVAGMQMPANMGEEFTRKYKEVFSAVARRNKVVLIPFLLEGVGGRAELNQPDRIHPTAAGHKLIAETAWTILEPVLKGNGPS